TIDQKIHPVRRMGKFPAIAAPIPPIRMKMMGGRVKSLSARMIPSSMLAMTSGWRVRSAFAFQKMPVVMLPRKSTTARMWISFRPRYACGLIATPPGFSSLPLGNQAHLAELRKSAVPDAPEDEEQNRD